MADDSRQQHTKEAEEDTGKAALSLDMFQCSHPKSTVEEDKAPASWSSAFANLFHHLSGGQKKDCKPFLPTTTTNDDADDVVGGGKEELIKEPVSPAPPVQALLPPQPDFTIDEQERLHRILDLMMTPQLQQQTTNLSSSSYLHKLATAAAQVALEDQQKAIDQEITDDTVVDFDSSKSNDDPQVIIQRLLKVAKRKEALQQAHQCYLDRIDKLCNNSKNGLLCLLEPCIRKVVEDEDYRMPTLCVLLGRRDLSGTLTLLSDLLTSRPNGDDDDNHDNHHNNIVYEIMRLCFHCAVAYSFLTTTTPTVPDDSQILETLKQSNHPALELLLRSFSSELSPELQPTAETMIPQQQTAFLQWHNHQVPSLLASLSILMRELLFPSLQFNNDKSSSIGDASATFAMSQQSQRGSWLVPSLDNDEASANILFASSSSRKLSSWLYAIACTMPLHRHRNIGPSWHRLYSSLSEGFNLSTLEHSLVGYHGPTLILVEAFEKETKTNITFGAFASQPWKKQLSPDYYGDSDSFLFQIKPTFRVWRSRQTSSIGTTTHTVPTKDRHTATGNYQYCIFDHRPATVATAARTGNSDRKYAQGIGMGGSKRRPRFFVAATLDQCYLGPNDSTFESSENETPSSVSSTTAVMNEQPLWDLHSLEIWGVGGSVALQKLLRHHSSVDARVQQARQVDKSAFLDDFRSGLIESKMFDFHQEMQNRDGGCLQDRQND